MTPGWLMGIGKTDIAPPAGPDLLPGYLTGASGDGGEAAAAHATRLGASAGTVLDLAFLLGTGGVAAAPGGGTGGTGTTPGGGGGTNPGGATTTTIITETGDHIVTGSGDHIAWA
jgi:hypothetical protein